MLTACGNGDKTEKIEKSGGVAQGKPKIITSIKPIQAIALAIGGESVEIEQLIPDYASPHDYSFKPSDIRKIKLADIIFRIDEHMETQLNGVFDNIENDSVSIVSLADVEGLKLLNALDNHYDHVDDKQHDDENQGHSAHDDDVEHGHDAKHDEHSPPNSIDYHLWTSPKNATLMANQIAKSLSTLDAKNSALYQQNIEKFYEKVKAESEKIASKLAPFKHKPYIVFHNSWQYFADEFGMQAPIVVDMHEGISSGAKTISKLRDRIVKENINCVFYDSSISVGRLNVITEKAKTVEIDVLAKSIALDQMTYIKWLVQMGNKIESCLAK